MVRTAFPSTTAPGESRTGIPIGGWMGFFARGPFLPWSVVQVGRISRAAIGSHCTLQFATTSASARQQGRGLVRGEAAWRSTLAREREHAPHAPALIESMRAVGYSLESAIADLIDNSISANASEIRVRYQPFDTPYVAILDNGTGMSETELVAAMRHGSRNPRDARAADDLGRFGLGLKTASLSQCRTLTVVSSQGSRVTAATWSLDVIARTQKWTLLELEPYEIDALPLVGELRAYEHGTLVLWTDLDRIGLEEGSIEAGLREGMTRVREHLSLVFHRFIEREDRSFASVSISLNEDAIDPRDPFLTTHRSTYKLPEQRVRLHDAEVVVQPYILPHFSKLTPQEQELAGGEEGLRRRQGFYVYRSRRLIVWGSWFRLARQDELTKLARVRVDIPNSLDSLWTLDIKKSVASPPSVVAQNLRNIVARIANSSRRVYVHRGLRVNDEPWIHFWDRTEHRDGIQYRVNRDHPLMRAVANALDDADSGLFDTFLKQAERTLPLDAIYADMAATPQAFPRAASTTEEELFDLAGRLCDTCQGPEDRRRMLDGLAVLEPFVQHPNITRTIVARLQYE